MKNCHLYIAHISHHVIYILYVLGPRTINYYYYYNSMYFFDHIVHFFSCHLLLFHAQRPKSHITGIPPAMWLVTSQHSLLTLGQSLLSSQPRHISELLLTRTHVVFSGYFFGLTLPPFRIQTLNYMYSKWTQHFPCPSPYIS